LRDLEDFFDLDKVHLNLKAGLSGCQQLFGNRNSWQNADVKVRELIKLIEEDGWFLLERAEVIANFIIL